MRGEDRLGAVSNYFIGNDPKKWRENIANYGRVRYRDVYPGIDLVYYGNNGKLEYDFIVKPGADPNGIRLALSGSDRVKLDRDGSLCASVNDQQVRWQKPAVYEDVNGRHVPVSGAYSLDPPAPVE